ncbi:Nif3-like dinuclear metal center hexameric protein [Leptobacterium flavescens]|uniref:GTP cyclohydrolase 1 type 2 homolog n=1 Tax=Leptobacterium flavescens TaxID=472055 RepID=A0A6P0UGH0_9FLAO|nr:Nif3-like dinuclear metal center hexameric protein [Leptobacterium flavescens]NER12381.1 Nif3-like dinuclear metal center hexameric protein [Leptobacterium flavescens]
MIVKDVIELIEEFSPLSYAEDFDNVGLLVGNSGTKVTNVLVSLDTLENVVDEAIKKDCNMIVSFHPIIFSGLKKITGRNYVERVVIKAIQNNIAIYAMHTALDNSFKGVNARICDELNLINRKILIPQKGTIKKLVTFVPEKDAETLRAALFEAGAGNIGNYDQCSFNVSGTGTFKGNEDSNPVVGSKGVTQYENEVRIGITFPKHSESRVLKALSDHHPYEEVAYEVTTLENTNQHIGMGMIGELSEAMNEKDFMKFLKEKMNAGGIRHSAFLGKDIKKVAVLGGSGAFAIENAKGAGADIFVTADVKYHQFFQAENRMIIADIGHFETEQFTKNLLVEYLKEKIHNFAIILSDSITNPIKYF